jgi:transcriptional regulator with XRE-family HTH domain
MTHNVTYIAAHGLQIDPDKLRAARLALRLTQRQLAQRVPIDLSQIGRYETGATQPSYETLLDLAKALKVKVEAITRPATQ